MGGIAEAVNLLRTVGRFRGELQRGGVLRLQTQQRQCVRRREPADAEQFTADGAAAGFVGREVEHPAQPFFLFVFVLRQSDKRVHRVEFCQRRRAFVAPESDGGVVGFLRFFGALLCQCHEQPRVRGDAARVARAHALHQFERTGILLLVPQGVGRQRQRTRRELFAAVQQRLHALPVAGREQFFCLALDRGHGGGDVFSFAGGEGRRRKYRQSGRSREDLSDHCIPPAGAGYAGSFCIIIPEMPGQCRANRRSLL